MIVSITIIRPSTDVAITGTAITVSLSGGRNVRINIVRRLLRA